MRRRDRAIKLLTRKLERRRALNEPEVRSQRRSFAPAPQSISLTFLEAEELVRLLGAGPEPDDPQPIFAGPPRGEPTP